MPQGARTNHFARGPLGGSYGPDQLPALLALTGTTWVCTGSVPLGGGRRRGEGEGRFVKVSEPCQR